MSGVVDIGRYVERIAPISVGQKVRAPALRPEDIEDSGTEVEILDEARFVRGRRKLAVRVKLPSGEERMWFMNGTSARVISNMYGTETKRWIGKKVTLVKAAIIIRGQTRSMIIPDPRKYQKYWR